MPSEVAFSGAYPCSATFTDGDLNLVAVTDPRGSVSGASTGSYTTGYTYDERGNRLSETAPAPLAQVLDHDSLYDVIEETGARGTTTPQMFLTRQIRMSAGLGSQPHARSAVKH